MDAFDSGREPGAPYARVRRSDVRDAQARRNRQNLAKRLIVLNWHPLGRFSGQHGWTSGLKLLEGALTLKKTYLAAGLTMAALFATVSAHADTAAAQNTGEQKNIQQQGVYTASASGSITGTQHTSSSSIQLGGSYFFTKNIEGQANITFDSVNSDNREGLQVGARYYFDPAQDKQLLPFVGAFFGFSGGNNGQENATEFGGEIGFQYFLAPNVSFTPFFFVSTIHITGNNTTDYGLQFGLTFWFK